MKVIYHVGYPLAWAKGGHAVQIYETIGEIAKLGIETAWLHAEDREPAHGDILHYFTRPPNDFHWQLARQRGMKIVVSELHQQSVLRPRYTWALRGLLGKALPRVVGRGMYGTMGVDVYRHLDAAIAVTPVEADYMRIVLGSPAGRTHYVPNGVDDVFFDPGIKPEPVAGLLYVAYICERKNSVEVARLAKRARIPVTFVGAPAMGESDYTKSFMNEIDGAFVHWIPEVADRKRLAAIYRGAMGLFLASKNEGSPLTLLEALACGTPVMAPDLPNLRQYFGDAISYTPPPDHPGAVDALRRFHSQCQAGLKQSHPVASWADVALHIAGIYRDILNGK